MPHTVTSDIKQRIAAFVQLGKFLSEFRENQPWKDYSNGVSRAESETFNELISQLHIYNGWFTEKMVRKAIGSWSDLLSKENFEKWVSHYPGLSENGEPKTVAVIMAGNIPLVGFHDLLCVLISGNNALIKLSSDDNKLLPFILTHLTSEIEPSFAGKIKFAEGKLEKFDAVIATGSDNSSRYFQYYFGKYPHIIRKNRTSVAVLSGNESEEELKWLGHDVFDYFGLGCRNVSKLFIPEDFDLDRFFKAIFPFKEIINHKKYANNYEYNKAIYLMNRDELTENGFLLLKEDKSLHSPLAMLFYERYDKSEKVEHFLQMHKEQLQCVVGKNGIPFGSTQSPQLWDYADGVDTLEFLISLNK
ncbi:MAG: acyl-CoA reductase [Bacteroidota bacterium]